MSEREKDDAVLDSAELKIISRSEQRKKNRLESRSRKKDRPQEAGARANNIFARAYYFLVEAKDELGRVVWPTRKETLDSTWRLLILVIICGVFLGLVDGILTRLLSLIV